MIYEIAGLKVEMNPQFGRLIRQSESYRSAGVPVLHIEPNLQDMSRLQQDRRTEEEQEYIGCSAAFCRSLIPFGRFFLHASAVVTKGEAYLFSAPSGTGKSTHTAMWLQRLPKSYILNDDKPVIQVQKEQITVWGTPFAGKTNLQVNREVPLKGICFLRQGNQNLIRQVREDEALALLLRNTWRPRENDSMNRLLDMMEHVVSQINLYEMNCTREPEAAELSYRVMKGEES